VVVVVGVVIAVQRLLLQNLEVQVVVLRKLELVLVVLQDKVTPVALDMAVVAHTPLVVVVVLVVQVGLVVLEVVEQVVLDINLLYLERQPIMAVVVVETHGSLQVVLVGLDLDKMEEEEELVSLVEVVEECLLGLHWV
jgi:hypothetical protein